MSLTQEDLKAISDLIDVKLNEQEKRINNRFDQVDKRFEQIDNRFDQVDKRFEQIDNRFDQIDKRFEQIDNRLDEHSEKFNQIDKRFDEQDKRFDKKLDDFRTEFKKMLIDNNLLIAENVQRVVSESEERLTLEIQDIKDVVAQNSYDIAGMKRRIS